MTSLVVLAAGAGVRMGGIAKALLSLPDGRTFVDAILRTGAAAGAGAAFVVVGPPHGAQVELALPESARAVHNPDPGRGMLSSVQCGVAALPVSTTAALIWPVDVPAVQAATVGALLERPRGRIVVPCHGGRGGHPVRLPSTLFPALLALSPAGTLREFLMQHADHLDRLEVPDRTVLADVDRPEDLGRFG